MKEKHGKNGKRVRCKRTHREREKEGKEGGGGAEEKKKKKMAQMVRE